MLDAVSDSSPSSAYADAIYYLHKEVGMSYVDIFGREFVVEEEKTVDRDGMWGLIDAITGKPTYKDRVVTRGPGMSAKAFQSYIDIMEREAEERERQQKKQKMRNSLRQTLR